MNAMERTPKIMSAWATVAVSAERRSKVDDTHRKAPGDLKLRRNICKVEADRLTMDNKGAQLGSRSLSPRSDTWCEK